MENLISNMLNQALLENKEATTTVLKQFNNKAKEFILKGCPIPEQKVREYFFKTDPSYVRGVTKITPIFKMDDGLLNPYFEVTRVCVGYMSPQNFYKQRSSLNDNFFENRNYCYSIHKEDNILVYYLETTTEAVENIISFETK